MARKLAFEYGRFGLGSIQGRAVVYFEEDGRKVRRELFVSSKPFEGAKAALIAFATAYEKHQATTDKTVEEVWKLWRADREVDGKKLAPVDDVWKQLKSTYAGILCSALTDDVHRTYARMREDAGRKPWTIWTELNRLRACLKWAHDKKHISEPAVFWNVSQPDSRQLVLSEEEALKLLDGCISDHVRLFVLLALLTSARHAAILELTWDRVDFERGLINFKASDGITKSVLNKSKEKNRATVPFGPFLRAALSSAHSKASSRFVVEDHGRKIERIHRGFKASVIRAGLSTDITPHVLRHTAATWAEAKTDIEKVARLLGHSDSQITKKMYVHPTVEPLRGVVIDLEERLKRKAG